MSDGKVLTPSDGMVLDIHMSTTATAPTNRPIDATQALAAFRPARFELGVRDAKCATDALWFRIGAGPSTSWVEVTLSALDLYDVAVFKLRGTTRTTLGTVTGAYADQVAALLVAEWCAICSRKGW